MQRPGPGDRTESDLQHARPVDAGQRRVRGQPALEVRRDRARVARVASQPRGAPEGEPVLVTVDLPDDLVVADCGIQIGDVSVENGRRPAVVHGIEMPVDSAILARESQPPVTEYVAMSREDPIGPRARIGFPGRPPRRDKKAQLGQRCRIEDEARRSRAYPCREGVMHGVPLLTVDLQDRKSTRLNSSHSQISYAVFCLKKKMLS